MKISKFLLKIQHLFGLNKDSEHIDDVTVNIDISFYPPKVKNDILFNFKNDIQSDRHNYLADDIVNVIKSQIISNFESNPKFEQRCRNVNAVWITFYDKRENLDQIVWLKKSYIHENNQGGSIMKRLDYIDGVLYYPIIDRKNFERDQKLKQLLS